MHSSRTIATLLLSTIVALDAAGQSQSVPVKVPGYTVEVTPLPQSAFPTPSKLCVFRRSVTDRFGIVTAEFGSVTDHFGDVTGGRLALA